MLRCIYPYRQLQLQVKCVIFQDLQTNILYCNSLSFKSSDGLHILPLLNLAVNYCRCTHKPAHHVHVLILKIYWELYLLRRDPDAVLNKKGLLLKELKWLWNATSKCDLEMRPRFSWFLHRISAGIGRLHHISHNTLHTAAAVFNLSQVDALDLKALKVHLLMCEAEPCLKCSHTEWRISRRSLCGSRSVRLIDCSGCSQHQHET